MVRSICSELGLRCDPIKPVEGDWEATKKAESRWRLLRMSSALERFFKFLGLNLRERYDTPATVELLGKSHDEILYHGSLSKSDITNDEVPQVISLLRCLLETVGGRSLTMRVSVRWTWWSASNPETRWIYGS